MLRSLDWFLVTDVSGPPIGLIFNGLAVQEQWNGSPRVLSYSTVGIRIIRPTPTARKIHLSLCVLIKQRAIKTDGGMEI